LLATPARRLAALSPLPFPRFLVALPPLEFPEKPIPLHQAFEGAECRFDPAIVHGDLQGTAMRGVPTRLSLLVITPPILCHPFSLRVP
jgi:hypothetical protein